MLAAERALQAAMRASDVDTLDRLLHPDLLAVAPDGALVDKAGDLGAHRSGVFTISELDEEDVEVRVADTTAVTFVVLRVCGTIAGEDVSGRMRYTQDLGSRRARLAGHRRAHRAGRSSRMRSAPGRIRTCGLLLRRSSGAQSAMPENADGYGSRALRAHVDRRPRGRDRGGYWHA